ncbi:uncharacterized protein G2W53_003640 [Senna tora]|uniref:Uncharacterized protein n=1 Tax=Senna tora TaxID=362788 RepID=A0A834XBG2_9FABA|nr:uncharacterized protein G2W53_003640 [Senna tora]
MNSENESGLTCDDGLTMNDVRQVQ